MPLAPRSNYQVTSYWKAFGHSYIQYSFGTADQTGRIDGIFGSALDIERGVNWTNYAVNGSQLIVQGISQGGYARVFDRLQGSHTVGGPYAPDSGGTLLCYGINDIGFTGNTTQIRTAFQHAMRTVISRCRMSAYFRSDNTTRTIYGAGFTQQTATDYSTGNTTRRATSTTSATITMTLPPDYLGEPVAICFLGTTPTVGGTVTFSGTAGVTGTLNTGNIMPSASFSHTAMIKRVTGLTSANAGQTIIATVSALDGGGASVEFDGWWLEAVNAPPVLVCGIAKLTATGYAVYGGWTGTEAQKDADVDNFNADLRSVVAEFDSMVQVADLDNALVKTAGYFFDGLHPNESGSVRCVDNMLSAYKNMSPTTNLGITANFNPPSPRSASMKLPRLSGFWYTAEPIGSEGTLTITGTQVGQLWALPIIVTSGRERYNQLGMEVTTVGTVTPQLRWGLYDDPGWAGYPQCLYSEATSGGAFSPGIASTGLKTSPTSGTGSIAWPLDPGLYWLAIKVVVSGTSQIWRTIVAAVQGITPIPHYSTAGVITNNATAYTLTGLGTAALPNVFPSGATIATSAPKVLMKLQ